MDYDGMMKQVLSEIDNGTLPLGTSLNYSNASELMNIINDCETEGFLAQRSSKQKLVTGFLGGGFMIHPTAYITRKGRQFLEGKTSETIENTSVGTQYNFHGNISGSNFGDHGTVTINYGASISDVKSLMASIPDLKDKEEAAQLVEIIEAKEPIKPGLLGRFDTLLGKYPHFADTLGKLLLSYATGMIE